MMQARLFAGMAINAAMLVTWALAVLWIMRVPSFPKLRHGRFQVSGRGMRVAWSLALFIALAIGGPSVRRTERSTLPASVTQSLPGSWRSASLARTPDYFREQVVGGGGSEVRFGAYGRADYSWQLRSGDAASYSMTELRLPLYFLLALFLFWRVIVRVRPVASVSEDALFP